MLRGDCLYDARVIRGLAKARQALLEIDVGGRSMPVAAHVTGDRASSIGELLRGTAPGVPVAGVARVTVEQVAQGFEAGLLKLDRPYVLPVTAENRDALEQLTFSGAYKGVTDLVTKWLWPRPARWVTRGCVRMGITPNQVTAASLVLVIVAGALFVRGEYAWGLLAGWIMTFLDTVDGKLARVTVTSTRFGNIFDHGIDLVHPPLWYIAWDLGVALDLALDLALDPAWFVAWGMGLAPGPATIAGVTVPMLYLVILGGYIGGRLCEGAFQRWIAPFSIFTWRPFDSWFRLIVARRNPEPDHAHRESRRRPARPWLHGGRRMDRAVDGDSPRAAAAGAAGEAARRKAGVVAHRNRPDGERARAGGAGVHPCRAGHAQGLMGTAPCRR